MTTEAKKINRPMVRCPHCGHEQVLVFARLQWSEGWKPGDPAGSVFYECEQCRGEIHEENRPQINALYTRSFAEVAEAFLTAKNDPKALRFFIENWLGEEWQELPPLDDNQQRPIIIRK
jgi:phage terminase large subunit GpA-like protein